MVFWGPDWNQGRAIFDDAGEFYLSVLQTPTTALVSARKLLFPENRKH
jgi:hypothetical protein